MILELILYSLIGGLFSLAGGLLLLSNRELSHKIMHVLISFAAGAFLGAALLDILPEALEMSVEPHPILLSALVGFVIFFVLERFLMTVDRKDHEHEHSNHTESLSFLVILGDCLHNFFDGIIIALAYLANPALGLPTALAVAAHEIPQEIADFSILMNLKWKPKKIVLVNILQSLVTIPGVFLGLYAGQLFQPYLPYLLGGTAGVFLYISASDLIPELHHMSGHHHFLKTVVPLIISVIFLYGLITISHG
jgi:zinc and cadmium transporter